MFLKASFSTRRYWQNNKQQDEFYHESVNTCVEIGHQEEPASQIKDTTDSCRELQSNNPNKSDLFGIVHSFRNTSKLISIFH